MNWELDFFSWEPPPEFNCRICADVFLKKSSAHDLKFSLGVGTGGSRPKGGGEWLLNARIGAWSTIIFLVHRSEGEMTQRIAFDGSPIHVFMSIYRAGF